MFARSVDKTWKLTVAFAAAVSFALAPAATADPDGDFEKRRAQCTDWMLSGYPSGIEEKSCTSDFALPSPFLIACARAGQRGFDSQTQRTACELFFAKAAAAASTGIVRN